MQKAINTALSSLAFFLAVFSANVISSQQRQRPRPPGNLSTPAEQLRAGASNTIRTRRIEIVDGAGAVRAVIGAMPGGETGIFVPNTETPLAFLGVSRTGEPSVLVSSKDGKSRGALYVKPTMNAAGLKLESKDGELSVRSEPEIIGMSAARKISKEEAKLAIVPGVPPGAQLELKDSSGKTVGLP
ncbi:MAG: hypothetical protein ACREEM_25570 [Blastocatellia bacterium]